MWTSSFSIQQAPPELRRKIARSEVNEFPLWQWEGPIDLVTTAAEADAALAELARTPVVGFDTETRPAFRKGEYFLPSLLQLATDERAWVFQLDQLKRDELVSTVLSAERPLKAGVSIIDDVDDLRQRHAFPPAGFLDLGEVARESGMETRGLRNLAANLLGFRISKSAQTSNWARPDLSEKQIRYAATDAWVGFLLFHKMLETGILVENP
mgnify:FL=1